MVDSRINAETNLLSLITFIDIHVAIPKHDRLSRVPY